MDEALAADAAARSGPYAGTVGAFVVPASRLEEVAASRVRPPQVSVILDRHVDRALAHVAAFDAVPIVALETPRNVDATRGELIETLIAWSHVRPGRIAVFCEVVGGATPLTRVDDALERLALERRTSRAFAAKIRTGGETPEMIPSDELLTHVLAACARLDIPFKATAGLHHPLRSKREGMTQHGFLNLLVASAVAHRDSDAFATIQAALEEEDSSAFVLEDDALIWRDHRFGAATLAAMRVELFSSFGSCSLTEPIDGLRELGFLE